MRTRVQDLGRATAVALLATILVTGLASSALAIGVPSSSPLPQILPIPQVGPLGPGGHKPGGGGGGPGNPLLPTQTCPRYKRVRSKPAPGRARLLHIKHVANEFGVNMFGIAAGGLIQAQSCQTLTRELNADARAGARWLRVDINWAEIQNAGPESYFWKPIDRVVGAGISRGMHVLGAIIYTPWWARPPGTSATYGPRPTDFAAFVRAAARHYARLGVHAFEIWNEPNSVSFWQPAADPTAYTAVLKAAYVAIKGVDRSATVLTGGLAPALNAGGSYAPVDFLRDMYAAGAGGSFDALADHPYCWPVFPGTRNALSPWDQMYGTHPSLRSVMIANGDRPKKIWATEFGAPTDGPAGTYVTPATQARMVSTAYRLFATYRWGGPLFFYQGRDLGTDPSTDQDFFGFLHYDFAPKPSYRAYRAASRSVAHASRRPPRRR